jgi:hypothetical protein
MCVEAWAFAPSEREKRYKVVVVTGPDMGRT